MLNYFRLFFIIFLSLIIFTCDSGGDESDDCPSIPEITDGCFLEIPEGEDGVFYITSSGSILYYSNEAIAGFQFDINGSFISDVLEGGDAKDADFIVEVGNTTVIGFSFTGGSIPAGCGILINLDLHCTATELNNVAVSNTQGQSLIFSNYENTDFDNIEDCSGVCGGTDLPSYQCDDGCTVCDESDCIEIPICTSCNISYGEDIDYQCCDVAWQEIQMTCYQLEFSGSYDCSGCECLGDCEANGLVTCLNGVCEESLNDCEVTTCMEFGALDDCSGDGDCCDAAWVGDGYCDGIEQNYGCNLVCYSLDAEENICWMDEGDNTTNINNYPICPNESLEDYGDCIDDCENLGQFECWDYSCVITLADCPEEPACDEAGGTSFWISDGWCDSENNNAICQYDGGDCCPCDCVDADWGCEDHAGGCDECLDSSSTCYNYQGDCVVTCGDGECYGYETAENCPEDCDICSDAGGVLHYISDGWCDESNNIEECQYDGGDCCPCTCEDGDDFDCDSYGGTCDECIIDGDASQTCPDECSEGRSISYPNYKDKKNKKLSFPYYENNIDSKNNFDKTKKTKGIY